MTRILNYIVFLYILTSSIQLQAAIRPYESQDFLATVHSFNSISGIKVLGIDLKLDLLLNKANTVDVTVSYKIECTNPQQNFRFILGPSPEYGNFISAFEFNGKLLERDTIQIDSINPAWFPKDSLQWKEKTLPYLYFGRKDIESYFTRYYNYISYTIDELPEGIHTITISYPAGISMEWYPNDDLSTYKSFVYVLQPEVDSCKWAGFNNLNLTVTIPKNCDYLSNIDFQKDETDHERLELSALYNNIPFNYISFTLHKDDSRAKMASAMLAIISSLIIVCICVFVLIKRAKKQVKTIRQITLTMKREPSAIGVLTVNYFVTGIILLIELIMIMYIIKDNDYYQLWWVVLIIAVISIPLSIVRFPSRHFSRKILRFLNCIIYGWTLLIAIYYIVKQIADPNENGIGVFLLLSALLIILYLTGRFSVSKRRQTKLVNGSGTFGIFCLLSLLVTIAFYIILFYYDSIISKMMDGFLIPNFTSNGMIILAAPFIFVFALFVQSIVYNIIKLATPRHN